jgi:hypothetical protein
MHDNDELQAIREWTEFDLHGMMEHVKFLWKYNDKTHWRLKRQLYFLSCGGIQDNESLIETMRENKPWWELFWKQSTFGGYYVFGDMWDWGAELIRHENNKSIFAKLINDNGFMY